MFDPAFYEIIHLQFDKISCRSPHIQLRGFKLMKMENRAMKYLVPALLLGLALAGCATPETKVRTKLIGLGVSPPMAGCMVDRMVDRLSYAQLHRLSELGGLAKDDVGDMRISQLVNKTRALQDPEIFSVVSRAALGCAISG